MGVWEIIVNVIYLLICVAIIAIVLLQAGRSAGISGAIAGGAETFFGKNKARSKEGILKKATVVVAVLFVFISIILSLF
ncbi:MAG: preprotein translocase subunit SecG [Bacteroidales bacterium]|nr:preprotein translocase subunit SecG [Bacteroidales bacterium]